MSIKTCVARAFCVVVTAAVAGAPHPARAGEPDHLPVPERQAPRATVVSSLPARAGTGFRLDRLSKGHVRTWRAIEQVVAASGPFGEPRSPRLRRLWEWARTSPHVLHVEMVSRSRVAAGIVGVFQVERVDPAGLSSRHGHPALPGEHPKRQGRAGSELGHPLRPLRGSHRCREIRGGPGT